MSFNFTRKVDYALVALATLAMPEKPGAEEMRTTEPRFLNAQQIAAAQGLPPRMVTNVLKRLHAGGLIKSRRGAGGGYWLARGAGEITVAEVLEVIQGPVKINPCCGNDEVQPCLPCQAMPRCPITNSIRQLNQMMVTVLRGVTIADLLSPRGGDGEPEWMGVVMSRSAGRGQGAKDAKPQAAKQGIHGEAVRPLR